MSLDIRLMSEETLSTNPDPDAEGVDLDLLSWNVFIDGDAGEQLYPDDAGWLDLPLIIRGTSPDDALRWFRRIQTKCNEVLRAAESEGTGRWVMLSALTDDSAGPGERVYWPLKYATVVPADDSGLGHLRTLVATLRLQTHRQNPRGAYRDLPGSGTLTNGLAAKWTLSGLLGDLPAEVRWVVNVLSGAPRGVRIGVLDVTEASALANWSQVLDLTPLAGAQSDASAIGGVRAEVSLPSTSAWTDVAAGIAANNVLNRGRRLITARFRDVPVAPTVSPPSSGLAASVVGPVLTGATTEMVRTYSNPVIVNREVTSANGEAAAGSLSFSFNVSPTSVAGNTQVVIVAQRSDFSELGQAPGTPLPLTAPSGFRAVAAGQHVDPVSGLSYAFTIAIRHNSPATSGTFTGWAANWRGTITNRSLAAWYFEVGNVLELSIGNPTGASSSGVPSPLTAPYYRGPSIQTSQDKELAFAVLAAAATGTVADMWMGNWSQEYNSHGASIATAVKDIAGDLIVEAYADTVVPIMGGVVSIRGRYTEEPSISGGTMINGGDLMAGTMNWWVQSVDKAGNISAPSPMQTMTILEDYSRGTPRWNAVAGMDGYILTWRNIDLSLRQTFTTSTSVQIRTANDGESVTALPTATPITANPSKVQVRVGNNQYADMALLPSVSGDTSWRTTLIGVAELPPTMAGHANDQPTWTARVAGRSGNSVAATLHMDALWIWPTAFSWAEMLASVTPQTIELETRPDGQVIGRAVVGGATIYRMNAAGAARPLPRRCFVMAELIGASSRAGTGKNPVSDLSWQFNVGGQYAPVYVWMAETDAAE